MLATLLLLLSLNLNTNTAFAKDVDDDVSGTLAQEDDVSQCSDLDVSCTTQKQTVVEKPEDVDSSAEDRCNKPELFKTPKERDNCRTVESRNRRMRAEARDKAEKERLAKQGQPAVVTPNTPPSCNTAIPLAQCKKAYIAARNEEIPEKYKSCEALCSLSNLDNKNNTMSCSKEERSKLSAELAGIRQTCGTGGHAQMDGETKKESQMKAYELMDKTADMLTVSEDGIYGSGQKPRVVETNNHFMGPSYCVEGKNVCTSIANPTETYNPMEIAEGYYNRNAGDPADQVPVPERVVTPTPRPPDPVVASTPDPKTTHTPAPTGRDPVVTNDTPKRDDGAGDPQPGRTNGGVAQENSTSNTGGSNGTGYTSGTTSGTSSGGSATGNFSNPFGNSSIPLQGTTGSSSGGGSGGFKATGQGQTMGDAVAGGDSGGGWGDGGGSSTRARSFSATGSRSQGTGLGAEGVNRNAAINVASASNSSGTGSTVANTGRVASHSASGSGDLNIPAFQAGYLRAPTKESLAARRSKVAKLLKLKRITAKQAGCAEKDLDCLERFFRLGTAMASGRGGKDRYSQQRGIASVKGRLPEGVWRGYTDILSHMAKIHDKMPLDYEGGVDD